MMHYNGMDGKLKQKAIGVLTASIKFILTKCGISILIHSFNLIEEVHMPTPVLISPRVL